MRYNESKSMILRGVNHFPHSSKFADFRGNNNVGYSLRGLGHHGASPRTRTPQTRPMQIAASGKQPRFPLGLACEQLLPIQRRDLSDSDEEQLIFFANEEI